MTLRTKRNCLKGCLGERAVSPQRRVQLTQKESERMDENLRRTGNRFQGCHDDDDDDDDDDDVNHLM